MAPQLPKFASVPGGRTLEELLHSATSLEPAEVARIGVQLGRALQLAHAAGRRPCGIAAREVVLAPDGRVVLARPGVEPQSAGTGQSDSADASLYAAPETLRGEHGGQQSEVYSVGVVVYRLLTGAFPVSLQEVQQERHVEAWTAREDLRGKGSQVPLPLAQVVERAINPRPQVRYATLDAFCANLQEAARELHTLDGPVRRRLRQGTALVVVLALGAFAWVVAHAPFDRPVVAVRFEHHAGSREARAIVDGMTIEMTSLLAQAEGLEVRAALSLSSDRYPSRDAVVFGSERRASFVVSGLAYGKPGDWRRVEASLVRVRDGKAVWTDSFSFVDGDIFAVQQQIAEAVVGALQMRFGPGQRGSSTAPPLQELFLRARGLQAAGVDGGLAAEIFERVVNADAEFAPASAALATTLGGVRPGSHDLPALNPGMAAAARRAHAKDPHLAEANAAMGLLSAGLCQFAQGKAYFREALQRNPSVTSTYIDYAISTLLPLRETPEALDVLSDALEVDPMSLGVRRALASVLVQHGDYARAREISRGVIEEAPDLEVTEQTLGRALYLSGRVDAADKKFQGAGHWGYRGYILAVQGHHAEARQVADKHPEEPARQMLIYAGLKDVDRTFDAFQRTVPLNPWRALTWMARPEIEPVLRRNARAAALRDQLQGPAGCADEHARSRSTDGSDGR